MKVCEKILSSSVIILLGTMYFELAGALGRYVIEQKQKQNNHTKDVDNELRKEHTIEQSVNSDSLKPDTGYNGYTSVSGHRVPVSGPRQMQNNNLIQQMSELKPF